MRALALCTFLVALGGVVSAQAVPQAIPYNGRLNFDSGLPYEGEIQARAWLYDAQTGGNALWGPEDFGAVQVEGGAFQLVLGASGQTPISDTILASPSLWIEWELAGTVMSPRQRVLSVPYARQAGNSLALGGQLASSWASKADLQAHPATATPSAAPPQSPAPGQLWLDSNTGALKVWTGAAWSESAGGGGGDLEGVSAGSLTNTFSDVLSTWGSASTLPIPDNNAAGATAPIVSAEASGTATTFLSVEWTLQLLVVSQVRVTLTPPAGLGGASIVLFEGLLAPQPGQVPTLVHQSASSLTHPALGALLGASPGGTWLLTVADLDFTVVQPPLVVGALSAAALRYTAVRSNHAMATGRFDVAGDIHAGGFVRVGSTTSACSPEVAGALRYVAGLGQLEMCNGANWQPVWQSQLGQTPGAPAPNCQAIRSVNPGAQSGVYWLDPNGGSVADAFQAYCNMDLAGGGWTMTLNLDTSDGHVMWWANPLWNNGASYGDVTSPFVGDHMSPAWGQLSGATEVLLVVHEQGSVVGWKRFSKINGNTMLQHMQSGDNTVVGNAVLSANTASVWASERLVRLSTQLLANRCVNGTCTTGSSGSPDGDRLGSSEGSPSDNFGGGLGNWHDMGFCCVGTFAGKSCNGSSVRTASEAQAGWCPSYGGQNQGGHFGTDAWVPATCSQNNSQCGAAAWASQNGLNYDYSLYLR